MSYLYKFIIYIDNVHISAECIHSTLILFHRLLSDVLQQLPQPFWQHAGLYKLWCVLPGFRGFQEG